MKNRWIGILSFLFLPGIACASGGSTVAVTPGAAGTPSLVIHSTTNSGELKLSISGAERKKYYILSKTGAPEAAWRVEAVVDCSVSAPTLALSATNPYAFFKVVSAEEFTSAGVVSAPATAASKNKNASRGGGKEWFVDRKNGRDDLDGRSKLRGEKSGPVATIKKAMTLAQSGDSVTIAGGAYPENLDLHGKDIFINLEGNVILH